jgi:hypothetical protein
MMGGGSRAKAGGMSMTMTSSGGHASTSEMSMHAGHGASRMAMGGITMTASHGATNILPEWLSVIWTLVFLAVVVIHARHVLETSGERQVWHCCHVLMALGMLFMFAPPSLDHFGIPATFWQLVFANAAGAVVFWTLVRLSSGGTVNRLWIVIAIDFAAMVYMWSPTGFVPSITWILVAYFTAQAFLWVTNRYRKLDGRPLMRAGFVVNADGTVAATAVAPLLCERDLRVSMSAMTLGMAYMLAAMQLLI